MKETGEAVKKCSAPIQDKEVECPVWGRFLFCEEAVLEQRCVINCDENGWKISEIKSTGIA